MILFQKRNLLLLFLLLGYAQSHTFIRNIHPAKLFCATWLGAYVGMRTLIQQDHFHSNKNIDEKEYPRATAWIKDELTKAGISPQFVSLKKGYAYDLFEAKTTTRGAYLFLSVDTVAKIEHLLINDEKSATLNEYAFIINREANHLLLKHTQSLNSWLLQYTSVVCAFTVAFTMLFYQSNSNHDSLNWQLATRLSTLGTIYAILIDILTRLNMQRAQKIESFDAIRDEKSLLESGVVLLKEEKKRALKNSQQYTHISLLLDRLKKRLQNLETSANEPKNIDINQECA